MRDILGRPPRDLYISQDGLVNSNPYDAIDHNLNVEKSSSTGAGCSQSPTNLPKGK
jgi:hypothetical protein